MKVPNLLTVFALTSTFLPTALPYEQRFSIQQYHYIRVPPNISSSDFATNIHIYNERRNKFPGTTILIENQRAAILIDPPWTSRGSLIINNILNKARMLPNIVIYSYGQAEPNKIQSTVRRFPSSVEKLELFTPGESGAGARDLRPFIPSSRVVIVGDEIIVGDLRVRMHHRTSNSVAAYLCIPENKIIFGGVGVYWGVHLRVDVAPTPHQRFDWQRVLKEIINARPNVLIPGNYIGHYPLDAKAAEFTLEYLQTFEKALSRYNYADAGGVIREMETAYPNLRHKENLYTSAERLTGNRYGR
ncbi:uncharacterized protein LOC135843834 [Planococcus citri]|uniref:uncharacterized protein LOC135843834 n=1 Tax=Planococcus citri TaxID=170843 RepID=UPI0031F9F17E